MQTIINFWNFFFWLTIFGFLIKNNNFVKILIYSEITWISIYCYTVLCGIINDDLTLLSTSIFVLGFAGLEFSVGILIIIFFKNINKTIEFEEVDENFISTNILNKKKTYINRFYWN